MVRFDKKIPNPLLVSARFSIVDHHIVHVSAHLHCSSKMAQRRRAEVLGHGGSGPLLGGVGSSPNSAPGSKGWTVARRALLPSSRQNQSLRNLGGGLNFEGIPVSIPEEDAETDLHLAFRTQPSLSVIKECFAMAIVENGGREHICSETDASGRLLLHCIGLNTGLILNADGSINSTTVFVIAGVSCRSTRIS